MFTRFGRKKVSAADAAATKTPKGFYLPETATALLETPRRHRLLEHIWQRTSVSRAQFAMLYRGPVERYAELVQQFPASESHHHSHPGGMLDHGLEIVAYALKLRQSHLLPVGAPSEIQAAQSEAWTAGIAYAALLHDIGKIAVDLHVELPDGNHWHPWHGKLVRPYRFRYRKEREYRLHGAAAGLLYTDILDQRILDWLSSFPELWAALIFVLAGQYEHAGILGELVLQADQASVAQDLGGDPALARQAPKHALQRKLLDGLRYLLKEECKLNQAQASDGWLTQDALWLVSKTICDKLRAHLLGQGIEGVPDRNTALFNVLQEHGIAQPTPEGKAIWRATIASASGWTNSFTFLKLSPSLIWDIGSDRPPPFNGVVRIEDNDLATNLSGGSTVAEPLQPQPTNASREAAVSPSHDAVDSGDAVDGLLSLFDSAKTETSRTETSEPPLEEFASAKHRESKSQDWQQPPSPAAGRATDSAPSDEDFSGMRFMSWLRNGIQNRHLKINDAKALVHTAAGTAYLVSPGIFQRFSQEHPEIARLARASKLSDWEYAQKHFERLRLHKRQNNGLNIWTCEVSGPRKTRRLHGYLLLDGHTLFPELPFDNPYLKLLAPPDSSPTDADRAA